jgi:hypothetical protein
VEVGKGMSVFSLYLPCEARDASCRVEILTLNLLVEVRMKLSFSRVARTNHSLLFSELKLRTILS